MARGRYEGGNQRGQKAPGCEMMRGGEEGLGDDDRVTEQSD